MPLVTSEAPETAGLDILVGAVTIGHITEFSAYDKKTRTTTTYKPLNDKTYSQIVSAGSVEYGDFSATVLYNTSGTEGINLIEEAFDDNVNISVSVVLNDAITPGGTGTKSTKLLKINDFDVKTEKDGIMAATFTAKQIGDRVLTPAT